jgi:hypothetical protein
MRRMPVHDEKKRATLLLDKALEKGQKDPARETLPGLSGRPLEIHIHPRASNIVPTLKNRRASPKSFQNGGG